MQLMDAALRVPGNGKGSNGAPMEWTAASQRLSAGLFPRRTVVAFFLDNLFCIIPPTLIPPSVQACLEALHIVQSASGEDLRAAAQMCSPPVRVHFHQSSKSINFQYQAWAPTDVPPVPEPIGLPLNPEKYPVAVESPTYSVSTTDESSDSDDSSSTYEDSDIVSVVAELVTDVENQLKENAGPTDAPLTHREIVALVEAIPNSPAP